MSVRFWNPVLRRLLERDPHEIEERARNFAISGDHGRRLVSRLGQAFLGGYHAMLRLASTDEVAGAGARVDPHYRPFFFEGAAMGYLPRGYLSSGFRPDTAERDLLEMHSGFRYLYYVGLGFWQAFRHPRNPGSIAKLTPHVDPMYLPLCYDGFGFKLGFFDYPAKPERARAILERCPAEFRSAVEQGFGRSLFFVFMDDEAAFRREREQGGTSHRMDREIGRSLALAFTGADRPRRIEAYLAAAEDEDELTARLTGVTWALSAREMNDTAYFEQCMAPAGSCRDVFLRLPGHCQDALRQATDYKDWQARTAAAAMTAYRSHVSGDKVRRTGR